MAKKKRSGVRISLAVGIEENIDNTTNEPRHHPEFYIPSGDIVFQVEKTIFKIHSHFLTTQSEVFNGMIAAPQETSMAFPAQEDGYNDGTNSKPLVLSGDRVEGWALFLSAIYRHNHLKPVTYDGKESIEVLRIAHKYCMNSIEDELISRLKEGNGTAGFLDLMVASRIVDSKELYDTALQGLIASEPKPTLEEARIIGIDAYYAVVSQSSMTAGKCRHCQRNAAGNLMCHACNNWQ
ncbi:hypothetical protein M408DRAFT_328570 [Serendipita vermifera MAFF 305830]|uniref:Uncharacterized protein n=1 Tax=Serendipita vermifera MAFF 305830 TaxID=933852 RepID=A0A0C2XL24_SERVB|nr:hypothetical protein M408DRAFT_328570 [Serendipita vermifera MAFF 305830]